MFLFPRFPFSIRAVALTGVLCLLLLNPLCALAEVRRDINNDQSAFGVNIAGISYWSTEWILNDFIKSSSGWLTQCVAWNTKCNRDGKSAWNTKEQAKLILDENGWIKAFPKQSERDFEFVSLLMFAGAQGRVPSGMYHVLYEGEGEMEYGRPAKLRADLSKPGHHVVEVSSEDLAKIDEGGVLLTIKSTGDKNGNNYLRNIRFIAPGGICDSNAAWYAADDSECRKFKKSFTALYQLEATQKFHPLFLQELKPFRVIRYMDLLATNTNKVESWEHRPSLDDPFYGGDEGAPFELAIQLSNAARADAWVNMPPRADDDYLHQAARYTHQQLKPDLLVYVELGNEAWNFGYPFNIAGNYYKAKAKALWGEKIDDYTGLLSWYAKRAAETCEIWRAEFGKDANRVKCVIGGMAAWADITRRTLECPYHQEKTKQVCGKTFDVLAIAPYMGGYLARDSQPQHLLDWKKSGKDWKTLLFKELLGTDPHSGDAPLFSATKPGEKWPPPQYGALQPVEKMIREHKAIADKYGLQLAAYEGGADLTQFPVPQKVDEVTLMLIELARDQRMGQVYRRYLDVWRKEGGTLFLHYYSVGRYNRWGTLSLKEYQGQADAPKYEAAVDFGLQHPCWWKACGRRH